jgi:membrane-associated protease RseP (regulator of RpoE activity)
MRRFVIASLCAALPLVAYADLHAAPARRSKLPRPARAPEAPEPPPPAEPPQPPEPPEPPEPAWAPIAWAHGHGGSADVPFVIATDSERGRLGLHVSSMTPELRKFFGAKPEVGILVQKVDEDGPAARGGVKVGDIVVEVDGETIDDIGEVAEALSDRGKGDDVDVVVVRKKARKKLKVELKDDAGARGSGVRRIPGGFSIGGGGEELEKLREAIEALEDRVDAIDRARKRKPKP